jgi:hypothetical protein
MGKPEPIGVNAERLWSVSASTAAMFAFNIPVHSPKRGRVGLKAEEENGFFG